MSRIWILFSIAFAADFDCLNLSPNVTDEECGKLDITVQYFDANENCSQALFKEKFESLDLSYAVLFEESFTAIREKLKATVWMTTRREVEKKYQDIDDVALRIGKTTQDTSRILNSKEIELEKQTKGNQEDIAMQLQQQKSILDNAVRKLSQAQDALRNLDDTIGRFAGLHNMYITIRAQSNRVYLCIPELRRVTAELMLHGAGKDAEEVLEDCKDLLSEDLAQKLLKTSATYCSSSEATRPRRFLSTSDVQKIDFAVSLTMAECLEVANYPNFRAGRTYENEDAHRLQQENFAFLDDKIKAECTEFSDYTRAYLIWKGMELLESDVVRVTESLENINREWSFIAEATETCTSQAHTMYQKFKANAELLAKGQACGQKMTERWSADVEKCLKANAWTNVWLPWYNIPHLFGDENNCVKTRNLILGGMITAMSSVVIFFVVIWCLRCACACSCRWLRCRKSRESRKRTNKRETKQTDGRTDQASNEDTKCTRTRTRPSKKDVLATVLENTRYHPSSDAASMSTNDHSSLVSDHSEFSRETNLYQPAVHPRTDYSSSLGYERNGRRSVASESSANSGRQPNESDLEAPTLFYLPNLLPNNVISPPTLITLPHIRPSTDFAARIAVPFTPHLGFAPQGAVQPPFGALPPACRTSTRSRTVPSYLTPPNSPAPTSLTTSSPAPSGHVARSTTRHQTAFISRP